MISLALATPRVMQSRRSAGLSTAAGFDDCKCRSTNRFRMDIHARSGARLQVLAADDPQTVLRGLAQEMLATRR